MAVTDLSDIRNKRRTKKIRRSLNKLIILLIAVALVFVLYITKSKWYPKLDGILSRIPETMTDGKLSDGNFPIKIQGGSSYQLRPMDRSFAVVDDSHIDVYNVDGGNLLSEQHTYSNPILATSNKKVLVYDLGGKEFSLYSKYEKVYNKQTDNAILLAKLSNDDHVAVVTKSDKYLSCLDVYDSKGNTVFVYKSFDYRIIDVTFTQGNTGCYITTIDAQGGQLVSQMLHYEFTKKDVVWQSDIIYTMALSTRNIGQTDIAVFGDTSCSYFDTGGKFIGSYTYDNSLVDFDSSSSISAILFDNEGLRNSQLVIINDILSPTVIDLNNPAKSLFVENEKVYVMDDMHIYCYSANGENLSEIELDTDYDSFFKIESNMFLAGYDEIDRIELS